MPYLGIFDQIIEKFDAKIKIFKFDTKMSELVFWDWNLKTILSYFKSTFSNLPNSKIL